MRTIRRPLPALPIMAPLWEDLNTRGATKSLEKTIAGLSEYHDALHVRAKAATAELIARYRQAPSDCLTILPA
jgi:hypothetical protein